MPKLEQSFSIDMDLWSSWVLIHEKEDQTPPTMSGTYSAHNRKKIMDSKKHTIVVDPIDPLRFHWTPSSDSDTKTGHYRWVPVMETLGIPWE